MAGDEIQNNVSIFDYLDYRLFLKDVTRYLKKMRKFRLTDFAEAAGLVSPGFLKMVIDRKRNLSDRAATGFCRALGLKGREQEYFFKLVEYDQSHEPDVRKAAFERLVTLKPRKKEYLSEKNQSRYYSRPQHVIIREMSALPGFQFNAEWISKRCNPPITITEAQRAMDVLVDLKLMMRGEDGVWRSTSEFIKTEDQVLGNAEVYHFHEAMIDLARHALSEVPQDQRSYYAITVPFNSELFLHAEKEFHAFRDRLIALAEEAHARGELTEVHQINFQMFPVTRIKDVL